MLHILPETAGDIMVLQATGKLTTADYQDTFLPLLEEKVATHGGVRCLIYLDHDFKGLEVGAMWEDTKLGLQHNRDFIRLAVVGDGAWLDWALKLGALFIKGETKHFTENQFLQALHWIDAGD
ncbi:STAS/SEC14 domain-containing protein [Amphritea opalescens]|uniref:STAS/SEC14 domain-containing protein n=1 Tax=Amphritea opalescens TaxID=2490544 RepID=A0A430KVE6_9GAMM|nr:STAS/SEC14 domain-containing protein [Amphritea opalescens]RTE67449.1 STAS/SEC14 domain-containing protein [Amphritea opalescens]